MRQNLLCIYFSCSPGWFPPPPRILIFSYQSFTLFLKQNSPFWMNIYFEDNLKVRELLINIWKMVIFYSYVYEHAFIIYHFRINFDISNYLFFHMQFSTNIWSYKNSIELQIRLHLTHDLSGELAQLSYFSLPSKDILYIQVLFFFLNYKKKNPQSIINFLKDMLFSLCWKKSLSTPLCLQTLSGQGRTQQIWMCFGVFGLSIILPFSTDQI